MDGDGISQYSGHFDALSIAKASEIIRAAKDIWSVEVVMVPEDPCKTGSVLPSPGAKHWEISSEWHMLRIETFSTCSVPCHVVLWYAMVFIRMFFICLYIHMFILCIPLLPSDTPLEALGNPANQCRNANQDSAYDQLLLGGGSLVFDHGHSAWFRNLAPGVSLDKGDILYAIPLANGII